MNKRNIKFGKGDQPEFSQTIDGGFSITQAEGDDAGKYVYVEGQAANYGNWFTVMELQGYKLMRRNNQGMFSRALSQSPDVVLKVNHDQELDITTGGTLKIWETEQGLYFKGRVNIQSPDGQNVIAKLQDKILTQGSVKYWPTAFEEWTESNQGDIVEYQDIKEGKLDKGDVSLVTFGANPQCEVGLTTAAQMIQMLTDNHTQEVESKEAPIDWALIQKREAIRLEHAKAKANSLLPIFQDTERDAADNSIRSNEQDTVVGNKDTQVTKE